MTAQTAVGGLSLAHADDGCDALPGGIALTFEATEIGGCDGERAVIEELADGLDRLADVATELGGGSGAGHGRRRAGDRPSPNSPGSGCRR